ncbi:MAG: hypothetical protein ACERKD_21080 [Prolixibacteraceae bacterium]
MLNKIARLLFFSLIFTRCISPVDVDIPDFDDKPVVNCFFNNKDPFVVHISLPASQLDIALANVENAQVQILKNEEVLASLPSIGGGYYVCRAW